MITLSAKVRPGNAPHAPAMHVSYDLTKQKVKQHNNCSIKLIIRFYKDR
jgi:hypothetical protein